MDKTIRLEDLLKLRQIEKALKTRYLSDPALATRGPINLEDFYDIYSDTQLTFKVEDDIATENNNNNNNSFPNGPLSKILTEESYFQDLIDVSAIMHLRYLPPIYHESEFFELDCLLQGQITSYIGNQSITLSAGDIMIFAPGTNHASCTYNDNTIMINLLVRQSTFEEHFLGILPENDLFKGFFEKSLYGNTDTPYLLFKTRNADFVSKNILPILEEYRGSSRYKTTMLSSLLSVFFVKLLRSHEKDLEIPSMSHKSLSENIVFILEYMQKNYTTITLSHLASFFNYSERQMQRIIESATGIGFSENIKKLRMNKAAELLRNTDMPVSEIADILGYYDCSSFRQSFKKYYGCSPRDFSRQSGL